ncbi:MAG: hypothetical protein ABIO62_02930 [Paracoccaceae bacterium]
MAPATAAVTILGQFTNVVGNRSNVYGAGYGANTPVGVMSFDILWGSIDSYNALTFNGGGGATAAPLTRPLAGQTNFEKVALVHIVFGSTVTTATFTSTSAAYEFGLALVPLTAGGLLLPGGLAAVRRPK